MGALWIADIGCTPPHSSSAPARPRACAWQAMLSASSQSHRRRHGVLATTVMGGGGWGGGGEHNMTSQPIETCGREWRGGLITLPEAVDMRSAQLPTTRQRVRRHRRRRMNCVPKSVPPRPCDQPCPPSCLTPCPLNCASAPPCNWAPDAVPCGSCACRASYTVWKLRAASSKLTVVNPARYLCSKASRTEKKSSLDVDAAECRAVWSK
ncbi:hypothetical protein T492DRAFT_437066 [Pavlovales sp. CCMP2436]|nr:hypothetical protein T492DRAFT_437066 [Pavlovales sp. CCMP2436]